jgi:hypothetical protein
MSNEHVDAQRVGLNESWPAILDRYNVQFLVLDIDRDSDLLQVIRTQPGWTVDFKNNASVVFARAGAVRAFGQSGGAHQGARLAA